MLPCTVTVTSSPSVYSSPQNWVNNIIRPPHSVKVGLLPSRGKCWNIKNGNVDHMILICWSLWLRRDGRLKMVGSSRVGTTWWGKWLRDWWRWVGGRAGWWGRLKKWWCLRTAPRWRIKIMRYFDTCSLQIWTPILIDFFHLFLFLSMDAYPTSTKTNPIQSETDCRDKASDLTKSQS